MIHEEFLQLNVLLTKLFHPYKKDKACKIYFENDLCNLQDLQLYGNECTQYKTIYKIISVLNMYLITQFNFNSQVV